MTIVTITDTHHPHRLVAVAVHTELRAGKLSVSHRPQTDNMVARVEQVCGVNKEETPFLLVIPLGKEGVGGVYYALDPSL